MRIITWNINGLKSAIEKGDFNLIMEKHFDIVCLQEVKISDVEYIKSIIPKEYHLYINKAQKNGYSGVAILSKKEALSEKYIIGNSRFDTEGRYIMLEFKDFWLYNIYIPHGGRDKKNLDYKLDVCNKLIEILKSEISNEKRVIVTTDFNIAHNDIDLARAKQNRNNIMYTDAERKIVDEMIKIGMADSFRFFTKEGENYTWWPYAYDARKRNLGWRIDYIFVSQSLTHNIKYVKILKEIYGSDHCPTELSINI